MPIELEHLADRFWDLLMEMFPSRATMLGDHRFNDQIEDLSEERESWFDNRLESIGKQAEAVDPNQLSRAQQVTLDVLAYEVARFRERVELRLAEWRSDQMDGTHATFLAQLPLFTFDEPDQAQAIVSRFRQVDQLLGSAADRFRAGLRRGRSPARINIERSIHVIDEYLAGDLAEDPIVNLRGPREWSGEVEWRAELSDVVRDHVRPAFARYRQVLSTELLPQARSNEQPGLSWIEGGQELYARLAARHTTTDMSPDEIHEIGREVIEQQLPDEYSNIGHAAVGISDVSELFLRLRTDESMRFKTGDEMIVVARDSLDRAAAVMGDWFGRLPIAGCLIEVVPEHLQADAPRAYYYPPTIDGSRPGTHFVNPRDPADESRYDAEAVAFHESIPGHHLQIAIASELQDVPEFQRRARMTAFVEGWGLYSERLSDEMRLYTSDLDRIGMLSGDSWRAGRLVVDTGIHHKGWSRQQAIDYLEANSAVSTHDIEVEVDRYIGIPGQALAYKIGQRQIASLRQQAEQALGSRFDIKNFHDQVLSHGNITLGLLTDLVGEWINEVGD